MFEILLWRRVELLLVKRYSTRLFPAKICDGEDKSYFYLKGKWRNPLKLLSFIPR